MPVAPSCRYRDLARPGVLLGHCAGAMGFGFGTVVVSDTETVAAADSTAAALRVTCCVMIARARERGRPPVGRAAGCRATWGPARVDDDALSTHWVIFQREGRAAARPVYVRWGDPVSAMPPPPSSDTGCMDPTIIAPRAEVLRDRYRSRLPERLQELTGPVEGNVDLPLHIVWSGRTSYSLDRPKSRMTLYRTVLAEGLSEDLMALLHHRLLTEQWPVLRRLISPYIREVWEDAFPELLHTAPADTTAA